MAIYKAQVESNYTVIPNVTAQDKSLSFESRGLLSLMLSLPDDWQIHKSWLVSQSTNCGRDKLTRMMKELQDRNYIRKVNKRNDSGQMDGIDWLVYPTAQLETRSTVLPECGKPAATKETLLQKKQDTKDPASKNELADQGFEHWWKLYPSSRRVNRIGCQSKFRTKCKKLSDDETVVLINDISNDIDKRVKAFKTPDDVQFMPTTEPYLNKERWKDGE